MTLAKYFHAEKVGDISSNYSEKKNPAEKVWLKLKKYEYRMV